MGYRKKCSGFTLVELIVVVSILAILMAFAVPQLIEYTKASHRMAGKTEAFLCVDAVQRYIDDLKDSGELSPGKIMKIMNQDMDTPDWVLKDYIYGGQKGARIVAVNVDLNQGRLQSLTYDSEYYTATITIDEDGNKLLAQDELK